jgi:hypothetical protein
MKKTRNQKPEENQKPETRRNQPEPISGFWFLVLIKEDA